MNFSKNDFFINSIYEYNIYLNPYVNQKYGNFLWKEENQIGRF